MLQLQLLVRDLIFPIVVVLLKLLVEVLQGLVDIGCQSWYSSVKRLGHQ